MGDRSAVYNGESVIGRVGEYRQISCCDCGLIHDIWPSYDASTQLVSIMFVRNDDDTRRKRTSMKRKLEGVFKKRGKRK